MSVCLPPKFTPLTNAIRALAMDAVQQANSGHPGAPMGMAEIAEVLWRRHLRHNPANPAWPDRDRSSAAESFCLNLSMRSRCFPMYPLLTSHHHRWPLAK